MPNVVDTPLGQARQVAVEGAKGATWVVECVGCGTSVPVGRGPFLCPTCGWQQQANVAAVVQAAVARR